MSSKSKMLKENFSEFVSEIKIKANKFLANPKCRKRISVNLNLENLKIKANKCVGSHQ